MNYDLTQLSYALTEESVQRNCISDNLYFFVHFIALYNNWFANREKVTNKLPHKSAKMALSYADNCHFKVLYLHGKLFVVESFANSNRVQTA